MDEVDKMLAAGFIRKVYYPNWLANVVLIKKANGGVEDVCGLH